jgi:hypothetical protein
MDGKQRDQNDSTDLTPTMQAGPGQDSEGGGSTEQMCTVHAVVVLVNHNHKHHHYMQSHGNVY